MSSSNYKTIVSESIGEFRDRGSKFLAYAYPIDTEAETHDWIELQRKAHPKARHWCYAWRLGLDKNSYRANDDGEPSGTAGRPILGQIDSAGLTNVLVIVVRYFGGTLLGTSGLIHAYRESAKEALQTAVVVEKTVLTFIHISFDYGLMSDVMNALKKLSVEIFEKDFNENARITIGIPQDKVAETWLSFKALVLKIDENEAATIEYIGGLKWDLVD
jgi:uncharacterized YigZ family protein